MIAAVLESSTFAFPAPAAGRKAAALRALMQIWEQEPVAEETESDTELMVMLSGMVGAHATALDAE